jgi:hypothetical protein
MYLERKLRMPDWILARMLLSLPMNAASGPDGCDVVDRSFECADCGQRL